MLAVVAMVAMESSLLRFWFNLSTFSWSFSVNYTSLCDNHSCICLVVVVYDLTTALGLKLS